MKITRTSLLTGIKHTMDLDVTEEQLERWNKGELVQDVFPHLSADEREFLISGATAEEWEEHFNDEYEDELEERNGRGRNYSDWD